MDKTKQQIHNLNIVDVIGRHIELKKKGVNFMACCPFHEEKTASFSVNASKGIYKCFGCGKTGDAIEFVREHKSIGFVDAVEMICKDFNIAFERQEQTPEQKEEYEKEQKLKSQLLNINEFACDYFQQQLKENKEAMKYALSRFNESIIASFEIGYAPGAWDSLLKTALEAGYVKDNLLKARIISKNDKGNIFDFFRNRLIFPIHNLTGRVVGFSGRLMPGSDAKQPKYMNTPETPLYNKSRVLYGLHFAQKIIKENDLCHLVEGNSDVVQLHRIGILNTVAPCGTALTPEQISLIKRFTNNINILFDGDAAGQKAIERNGELILKAGMNCTVTLLPDKQDPAEFFKE